MRIRFQPTGCDHIRLETLAGTALRVVTLEELKDTIRNGEDPLFVQLKHVLKQYVASGSSLTVGGIKLFVESQEF